MDSNIGNKLYWGAIGLAYAWFKKPLYVATATFVLDDGDGNSSLSQYSGLASIIGMNTGGSGNLFQGENIMELYKSRMMIKTALYEKVAIAGKIDLLINRYIKVKKLKELWEEEKSEARFLEFNEQTIDDTTRLRNSVLNGIIGDIRANFLVIEKLEKSQSILKVVVKSPDEMFSKHFNDKIVYTVNDFYVKTKTKKAMQDLSILQHQLDSVRVKLNGAITDVAASTDNNPNPNPYLQILKVPSQKRQIDAQTNAAILTQLNQNVEIAKASMRREMPLIQIVDAPFFR
ncbi:lipopolysaccharide biosynthesis protein [Mucilaginibacter antarcticus]|uniref:lipopolysaccharide biosynthesis protein n=1 Tax=Mucilaginibacter antarcticus TaxID=1855725 RepID=UPI0036374D10